MGNLVFQATLGGQVNLVGPNTASTYNLNVPAVSSTIATTSGTETLTNKTLTNPVINGFTGDTSVVNIGSGQLYKDTSGNLGLGVTPSAWVSGSRAFQLGAYTALSEATGGDSNLTDNSYLSAVGTYRSIITAPASRYQLDFGVHKWLSAASVTAGSVQTFNVGMTLDASGNLGIGITSPSAQLHLYKNAASASQMTIENASSSSGSYATVQFNAGAVTSQLFSDAAGGVYDLGAVLRTTSNHPLIFGTNSTERARIDTSGNFMVAVTSTTVPGYGNNTTGTVINANNPACFSLAKADFVQVINQNTIDGSNYDLVSFRTGGSARGNILSNGTTVSYNTSSDYRLKENVQPMTGALATVAQLKPCTYTWKETGQNSQGFIAHELAEVVPDAVSGEKDAVNEDGSIKPQGIDTSFLVATLTAALQEMKAIVDAQAARITALEQA